MKSIKFYIVDVFAEKKFKGNQLAVCIPEAPIKQDEMQQIAQEINFSETTFILSTEPKNGGYDVKIFTPDSEIPFAGHPTLGTAYIINHFLQKSKSKELNLNYPVGQIPVVSDGNDCWMTQNQPKFGAIVEPEKIAKALNIQIDDIDHNYPIQIVSTGLPSIIVNLKTLDAVKRCRINSLSYEEVLEEYGNANLLVFTTETVHPNNDLHVRLFMYMSGYLEDPATGSANGNLAGYLLNYNFFNSHEIDYTVEQGYSIGRESLLKVKAQKNEEEFLIQVGGSVYVVAEGKWLL